MRSNSELHKERSVHHAANRRAKNRNQELPQKNKASHLPHYAARVVNGKYARISGDGSEKNIFRKVCENHLTKVYSLCYTYGIRQGKEKTKEVREMNNTTKVEIMQEIINSNMPDYAKVNTIQSFLLGWLEIGQVKETIEAYDAQ